MDQLRFTIPQILSLVGVSQCVYLLVYMTLRSGSLSRALLPMAYFFVLGLAFLADFANSQPEAFFSNYDFYFRWAAWFFGPPLSVLLIIQIAQISKTPALRHYWVLLLVPLAFGVSALAARGGEGCRDLLPCDDMKHWLGLTGLIAGGISLLTIWSQRDVLSMGNDRKTGKDRYWLVISIIFANIAFLATMLTSLSVPNVDVERLMLIRAVIGLAFVYLVGTSLFRIYPQAVALQPEKSEALSPAELGIARKIEQLLTQEKVYQEAEYTRTDLAQEVGTSESAVSRIINVHFRKSFPQIISEHRVADAKQLLGETEANIQTIAKEVGFNSVATFNRVFREITRETPSTYRKKLKQ